MADKSLGTRTTAIEAFELPVGNNYRKSGDGLGEGNGDVEVTGDEVRAVEGEDNVDEAVVAQGLQALETKKTAWYAYLTTRDFWIVLFIGYALSICLAPLHAHNQLDKFLPSASLPQTPSPPSSSIKEHPSLPSKLSSTTLSSAQSTQPTQSTNMALKNTSNSC